MAYRRPLRARIPCQTWRHPTRRNTVTASFQPATRRGATALMASAYEDPRSARTRPKEDGAHLYVVSQSRYVLYNGGPGPG